MNERLNEVIEDTLRDNYIEGISNFMTKMSKNIEPSVETCRKMFYRTNSGEDKDLYTAWEKLASNARKKAAKVVFGI